MIPELGVCYYPEHWPESQWSKDANQMRELGLTWVRIGEFAWSRLEPAPGDFRWEWLDKAIAILGEAGLKVVLGTPTATPPRWMIDKYPDMLAVDEEGRPRKFGSRRHYCFSHTAYRDECVRIADMLGKRYGKNSHVQAWQTDNEYGCHDTILSYSAAAKSAFQAWLVAKYQSIATLNEAWGNVFWSMEYERFDQIDLPNLTVTEPNPAHVMDFRRFSSDQVVRFNRAQCDVLRRYTDKPLIHNYMGRITSFDHFAVGKDLDIASWDSYPLGFLEDRSDEGEEFKQTFMRQGDPDFQAFHHDLYRAVGKERWWVMEQQPGPVNWAPYNPAPLDGMVRLWTWEAIAHGAEVVSYFRWRQAPFGQEQMHAGLQRPDSEWAEGAAEVKAVAKEISKLTESDPQTSPVALVFDYKSAWAWETQPQGQDFDYFKLVYHIYRGLRRLGLSVDILSPETDDFADRKLVCIPGLYAWTEELKTAIEKSSCQILVGPRAGSRTGEFKIPAELPPNIPGFDCRVTATETLRPSAKLEMQTEGYFKIWRELTETQEDIIEQTKDGKPALISNGNINYLTGWPDKVLLARILTQLGKASGIKMRPVKGAERYRNFGDFTLYMNYENAEIKLYKTSTKERLF